MVTRIGTHAPQHNDIILQFLHTFFFNVRTLTYATTHSTIFLYGISLITTHLLGFN